MKFNFLVDPSSDQIRRITALYRFAGWWGEAVPDNPSLVRRIIEGSHCFLVAVEGGEIIGMGRAISDGASDSYIQDLTVSPSHRGQGVGARIVKRLVSRLEKDGIKWIGLVAERNSDEFYGRLGFGKMTDSVPMLRLSK
jgi:spermidine synthase